MCLNVGPKEGRGDPPCQTLSWEFHGRTQAYRGTVGSVQSGVFLIQMCVCPPLSTGGVPGNTHLSKVHRVALGNTPSTGEGEAGGS
jgi:hypothetical protein